MIRAGRAALCRRGRGGPGLAAAFAQVLFVLPLFLLALKNLIDWLSRPVAPGDYSTAAGRGKLVAISSAAGASGGAFSLAKLRELLVMLGCTVLEEETRVPLGSRFGQKVLSLLPEEEAMLERECSALIGRLAD